MTFLISTSKTLILNEKNEILVLKIGEHTLRPERSHSFDLPGGFINDGESERDGAVREVKEETGIELHKDEIELVYGLTGYYNEDRPASVTHLTYLVKLDHTPQVSVSWEHEGYVWVDFESVLEHFELRPHYQQAIKHVLQYGLLTAQKRS